MMNILSERIKKATLTKTQRRIAEFFLQNQDRIGSMSSQEVANEVGVSDVSIIRFARALGFDGYADLKEQVYRMLVENAYGGQTLSDRLAQNRERYGGEDPLKQFQELMMKNIESVFRDNTPQDFERVADLLAQSRQRYIVGLRGCKGLAVSFSRQLTFMLPRVIRIIDGECTSINAVQDIGPEDVMLMFAYSRFYKIDVSYMKQAQERGARICLLTNDITSPLCQYADIVLTMTSMNLSFFHSMIGLDCATEYLANLVSDRVEYQARMNERDEITRDQRL